MRIDASPSNVADNSVQIEKINIEKPIESASDKRMNSIEIKNHLPANNSRKTYYGIY